MSHRYLITSTQDRAAAEALVTSQAGDVTWEVREVTSANDGTLLSSQLPTLQGEITILLSSHFLENTNCVSGLTEVLTDKSEVDFILHESAASVLTPEGRAAYAASWEDRYIDLRRDLGAYQGDERDAFQQYLDRVREASIEVAALLTNVVERTPRHYSAVIRQSTKGPVNSPTPVRHTPIPQPSSPEDCIERAWAQYDSGQQAAGIDVLYDATQRFPDQPELAYHRAIMLALVPDGVPKARAAVDELLGREPVYADALMLSGELYLEADQPALARQDWTRLADVHPHHPQVNQRLADLLRKHYPEAVPETQQCYRRALKDTVGPDFLYGYADWLVSQRKEKKAKKALKRLLRQAPNYAPARYRLAVLAHAAGRPEASAKHFARAAALDPDYDTPTNRMAFANEPAQSPAQQPAGDLAPGPEPSVAVVSATSLQSVSVKTVLISGATSGIGLATARRLAAAGGYRIIAVGRREDRLTGLQEELMQDHSTEVRILRLDVTDRAGVATLIDSLPADWQTIDLLINNAGKAKGFDPIQRGDIDHWEEMIDVNLKGLLYLTRAVSPGMVERQGGMIVNVCSTAGKEVYPNGNVYCATKHAVNALTYAMRLDLVKHGIRVGQICPAHVEETEFAVVRFDGDRERAKIYEDFQPLRSSDVAEAIYFMVSQPPHVNVMDMVLQGTQQASSMVVDRSGRDRFAPKQD